MYYALGVLTNVFHLRKFPDNLDGQSHVICLVLMAISIWDVGVLKEMFILLTYLLLPKLEPKLEFVPNSQDLRSNKLLMARDPIHD